MWLWWKRKKNGARKLKLEFNKEQLALIKHLASQDSKSPEQWAKEAVLSRIPPGTPSKLDKRSQAKAMMGAAFNQLEAQDREHPSEAGLLVEEPEAPASPIPEVPHSCFYLDPAQPTQYKGQCSGVCNSPAQRGRVCFWSSMKARECPVFRPRRVA